MESYLFVYGTLRQGFPNPLQHVLSRRGSYMGRARFHGRLFEIDGYPGAVPSLETGEWVVGEVYRLQSAEELLLLLDEYEECSANFPEPREYRRQQVPVEFADGQRLTAWTYLYNRPVSRLTPILSGDYVRYRKTGEDVSGA